MNQKFILFFAVIICHVSGAQKLSGYEKRWALAHPVAAIKVKHISKKCFKIYEQVIAGKRLGTSINGGKLDAFRHVYFMAAFAQKVNIKKLKKLGMAHEKANYRQFLKDEFENGELPDSTSTVMDLINNDFGLKLGANNKKEDLNQLCELVITTINNGEAVILKKNKLGSYLDCDGNEIESTKQKKWHNNKCIVKSNEE